MDQKHREVELLTMLMHEKEADQIQELRDARMEHLLVAVTKPKFYKAIAWMAKLETEESSKEFRDLVRRKLQRRFYNKHVNIVMMNVKCRHASFFKADVKVMIV